jgi:predicted dehydrogenase
MVGIGVLGAGYWGPKHVRNFSEIPEANMAMVADLDRDRLAAIKAQFPAVEMTMDHKEMLASPDVHGVVVATPVSTHARFAREALMAGKHVMVEKPLARSSAECQELARLAADRGKVLMVGHTFLYNPAVRLLREIVQSGEIGEVYYAYAQRLNLGLFQRDINVIWDLAPHDLSIMSFVLGRDPTAVGARGADHVQAGIEDVAYLDVAYGAKVRASIHVSWLDPNKIRRITIVGSKRMVVYNDVELTEKIRIYDKGVDRPMGADGTPGAFPLAYRHGDITVPTISAAEPLRLECEHFVECIATGARPLTDAENGLKVVRALEASDESLRNGGLLVSLDELATGHLRLAA